MNISYNILIGGKAGEGIKKAAQVVASVLMHRGWNVFQQDDYQSLIKGGHNYSSVSFSLTPVLTGYSRANMIVSLDDRSLETHKNDLLSMYPNSYHCYNADLSQDVSDEDSSLFIGFPFTSIAKKLDCKPTNISVAAIALVFAWMDMDFTSLEQAIRSEFKRDWDENIRYAKSIWELGKLKINNHFSSVTDHNIFPSMNIKSFKRLISGNQAIALGAWAAGLDFYYAYPMTPASSILHYLALKQSTHKVYAIHAESELAAANMAVGSVFAGAKTAVGSSGGGFALMQEAFSLAGMVEAPLLFILSSRPGPATGVSTYTAQEDLEFALAQGHGEFGRVVASPDSIERAYTLAAELLYLAWEYQSPVILLTEKHLSESSISIGDLPPVVSADNMESPPVSSDYERYTITDSGVSPLIFPGVANVSDEIVIKWNSHEHDPSGLRTDKADNMILMKDKRSRKYSVLHQATKQFERVRIYGESGPIFFAYGSAVMELLEARKQCNIRIRIIALIYLLPFPAEELSFIDGDEVVTVEHSTSGSLAKLIKNNLNVTIKTNILRYDGRPWDPVDLAEILKESINA